MPVIHERPGQSVASRHPILSAELVAELRSPQEFGKPLILVYPYARTDLLAVTVVWDKWDSIDEVDRAAVILEAYGNVYVEEQDKVAVAIGYTEPEAVEFGILPFEVVPLLRKSDPQALSGGCKQALLDLDASDLWKKGFPRLRLPTLEMAEQYVQELIARVPGSEDVWSTTRAMTAE